MLRHLLPLSLSLGLLLGSSCTAPPTTPFPPAPVRTAEVEDLLEVQRQAWNRGDLRTFVDYYHPTMTFLGGSGITRGTEDLLTHYQNRYPTAAARGRLTFEILEVQPLDGVALVLGRYNLEREEPAFGFFTLIVKRFAEGLRIVHDHTTAAPETEDPTRGQRDYQNASPALVRR